MDKRLSIVVIEPDPERAAPIVDGLREIGDHDIRIFSEETGLARHIAECRPDIVLIDPDEPWLATKDRFVSRSKNTPFEDARVTGRAVSTYVSGERVYSLG